MRLRFIRQYAEIGEILSFEFVPLEPITWIAGQYLNLTMEGVAPVYADRLFTIASAMHEQSVRITTIIGPSPFKQALARLQADDIIEADQIGGDFVWGDDPRPKIFVSGGIGITPVRSMLIDRSHHNLPINATLAYAGAESRRPFMEEITRLCVSTDLRLGIYDAGNRLTARKLIDDYHDVFDSLVYISGSQGFVESIGSSLMSDFGLCRAAIKYDYFDGYPSLEYDPKSQ